MRDRLIKRAAEVIAFIACVGLFFKGVEVTGYNTMAGFFAGPALMLIAAAVAYKVSKHW